MAVVKTGENIAQPRPRQGRIPRRKSRLAASTPDQNPPRMYLCWTTVATRSAADHLATEAISRGLAVCVQIDGPITSHYRWQGSNEQTEEFRLCFKVLPRQLAPLEAHVLAHHPYDTPEWVAVAADRVAEKYLSWAEANSTFPPFHTSQPPL